MKKLTSIMVLLIIIINVAIAQDNNSMQNNKYKSPYPQFMISPYAGVIIPTGVLNDNYRPSPAFSMDIGYRANKEVGLYAKFGYVRLNSKQDNISDANYYEISLGPRYYFNHENLKSNIFLEGGIGAYTFSNNTLTIGNTQVAGLTNTRVGLNTGIGASMALSDRVRILVKGKYTMIFTPSGSDSFVTSGAGLEFIF